MMAHGALQELISALMPARTRLRGWFLVAVAAALVAQALPGAAGSAAPRSTWRAPARPDLLKCGGWQERGGACEPLIDDYGQRTAARADAARSPEARMASASGSDATIVDCPSLAFEGAICGRVPVPLDRDDPSRGTIDIAFELYLHVDPGPAESAILVNFGGPGGGTTPSRGSAFYLFGDDLDVHDILLIDDRGKGRSHLIDCPKAQYFVGTLEDQVTECGDIVGDEADAFGTGDVAQDTDAVRDALGYDLIDFYGVSYGGADITGYATRYPDHIRSLVLDAPWGDTDIRLENIDLSLFIGPSQDAIRLVCERSPSCRHTRTDPVADFASLVASVRDHPVTGSALGRNGRPVHVRIDPTFVLDYLMLPWGLFTDNGEIAAAAAALDAGDPVPLLRLAAEGYYRQSGGQLPPHPAPPVGFTVGGYLATYCPDNEWNWDWSAPPEDRAAQDEAALEDAPQDLFAPFTGPEAATSSFVSAPACRLWPDPTGSEPIAPSDAQYPDVPTLVIGGDLDNIVPLQQAQWMADLFPGSHYVPFASAGHGAAFWRECARKLVADFVETLELGDTGCASKPEFRIPAVGEFPQLAEDATPAEPWPHGDNAAGREELRVAAVAGATVRDELQRAALGFFGGPGENHNQGLRGGGVDFEYRGQFGNNWRIVLDRARFARDLAVSGVLHWRPDRVTVTAEITVDGPGRADGTLSISTHHYLETRYFRMTGTIGGHRVDSRVPQS
jgi:pimeloyl-ACP methyl ester carboxylesterase